MVIVFVIALGLFVTASATVIALPNENMKKS